MTERVGVAAVIRARLGECSPGERKVGRALLATYPAAGLETVAALADRAGVSAPTVLRFLSRLGFGGFPEFQRVLREELAEREISPLAAYAATPGATSSPLSRAAEVLPGAVAGTLTDLPEAELQRAVRLLANRQLRVTAAGGRFSALLAQYLVFHLMQLRGTSRLLPAGPVERVDALVDVGRRDLFVLFDFRRYEASTLELARTVKHRGARVILCTDRWLSPIAGLAEVVLPSRVDSPSLYDSFVPALALLEALVAGVIDELGAVAQSRLAAIEAAGQPYL
ncbi:MurR/RpiR family transcriptional regulator [Krasilnikovia sp. M28-CT-15]|uniref:MurR/RpiR family transcriptional regulator n=1 Tax=Krasilnikovia sp. M28-CT-15 TaxID=3373540 RepID=UPI003876CFD8